MNKRHALTRARLRTPFVVRGRHLARIAVLLCAATARAQDQSSRLLDSLVRNALDVHPAVRVAEARATAARTRIAPASARPDPMLMAGLENFPISEPGLGDVMTMKTIGITQSFPYPGKRDLRTGAARASARASDLHIEAERRRIRRRVEEAYYDVVAAREVAAILASSQALLADLLPAADAHLASGTTDLGRSLATRQEAAAIAIDAIAVREEERTAIARLNATLARENSAPVRAAGMPERVRRLAGADSSQPPAAATEGLGDFLSSSPLPPLDSLERLAVRNNPPLLAHAAGIDARTFELALARRAHLPDIDVAVAYAHRSGFADMLTATVSIPLAWQRGRVQEQRVADATAELVAVHAEHRDGLNTIREEVARLAWAIERERAQLAVLRASVVPLDRAMVDARAAAFRAGTENLVALVQALGTQLRTHVQIVRSVARVGGYLAQLEELAGVEVVR